MTPQRIEIPSERFKEISAQTNEDPIVQEQLAMAWERLANLPPPQGEAEVYEQRLAAWDEAIRIRTTLGDHLTLTGTRYSFGGYGLNLAMNTSLLPALRLKGATRARKEFIWCRDNGDFELLAGAPEPYRELLEEEIAICDAVIIKIRESIMNPQ